MGSITSSGLISGIDSQALINQLLALRQRPIFLAQQQQAQLSAQRAAYSSISGELESLRSIASSFRTDRTFDTKRASSGDDSVFTATATTNAQIGSYGLLVDRLVSTQQRLSRGFADRDTSAFGADSITFESERARVDRSISLTEINSGNGLSRGTILIEAGGSTTEVDLSKVATVREVLDTINSAGITGVTARTSGGSFVIDGADSVTSATGYTTAESLGLDGVAADGNGVITGTAVFGLSSETLIQSLNDGNGVDVDPAIGSGKRDLVVDIGGTQINVNLGVTQIDDPDPDAEDGALIDVPAPSTLGEVVDRINEAIAAEGFTSTVSIGTLGTALTVNAAAGETVSFAERTTDPGQEDPLPTTARDLGLAGLTVAGGTSSDGERILAGLNTVLTKNLGGGGRDSGLPGSGTLDITLRDGSTLAVDLSGAETLEAAVAAINSAATTAGFNFSARVNDEGNGLAVEDGTNGLGNLIVWDADDGVLANALGIGTGAAGVEAANFGGNAQLRYISEGTLLSDVGDGIDSGTIRVTNALGVSREIIINGSRTIGDVAREISGDGISARVNDTGDGLIIESTGADGVPIRVEDVSGSLAESLRIAGTSSSGTSGSNAIDGTFEVNVAFDPSDTLDDAVQKINDAGVGVSASIVNDGSGSRPFRLSLASTEAGSNGRTIITASGTDLGLTELDRGEDARVFLGSGDPATSLLLSSTTGNLDSVIEGVSIRLESTSTEYVQLNVSGDSDAIETKVNDFINTYNGILETIDFQTRYVEETEERGVLLGDGTTITLERELTNAVLGRNQGFTGAFDRLTEIGIRTGTGGRLELDSTAFRRALENNPDAVEDLFTRRAAEAAPDNVLLTDDDGTPLATLVGNSNADRGFAELGVIPAIEQLLERYVSNGVLDRREDTIQTQIDAQTDRIESLNAGIERERARLESQFLAMERALAEIQSQQQALASFGGFGGVG